MPQRHQQFTRLTTNSLKEFTISEINGRFGHGIEAGLDLKVLCCQNIGIKLGQRLKTYGYLKY